MTDWRKSSASTLHESCVAVRRDLRALRDTKEPDGPVLAGDVRQLVQLIASATQHHRTGDATG